MLQQYEDALVQYDELDALFTQYVLNFGAGGTVCYAYPPNMYSNMFLIKHIKKKIFTCGLLEQYVY